MSDFSTWFYSMPYLTRNWLALTVGFSIFGKFGLISPHHLILLYEPFVKNFQLWRAFTALFYYPTGFHFLINCYFLYSYSMRLESGAYGGRTADYLFLLVFNWFACILAGLLLSIPFLMDPMVLSVLCIWCNLNKNTIVSFWFGSRFKAMYLPWVLFAFNVIVSGGGAMELLGIVIGHLYYFLMYAYPQEHGGPQLISTPQIFYDMFPNDQGAAAGFGTPQQQPGVRRHNWGSGHVLGSN